MKIAFMGAFFGFLAVLSGAFGAHVFSHTLDVKSLEIFKLASNYMMYHGIAILICETLIKKNHGPVVLNPGILFVIGTTLFSGSLFMYVLTGLKFFALVTPLGGTVLLLAWSIFALKLLKIN